MLASLGSSHPSHLHPAVIPLSVCNTRADYSSNIQVKTHCFCSHFTGTRKGNNQVGAQQQPRWWKKGNF